MHKNKAELNILNISGLALIFLVVFGITAYFIRDKVPLSAANWGSAKYSVGYDTIPSTNILQGQDFVFQPIITLNPGSWDGNTKGELFYIIDDAQIYSVESWYITVYRINAIPSQPVVHIPTSSLSVGVHSIKEVVCGSIGDYKDANWGHVEDWYNSCRAAYPLDVNLPSNMEPCEQVTCFYSKPFNITVYKETPAPECLKDAECGKDYQCEALKCVYTPPWYKAWWNNIIAFFKSIRWS